MSSSDRTMTYHHLREALGKPGCPLCRLGAESGRRFVEDLLYDGVTDPDRRLSVRQSLGFCRDHSEVLLDATASLGVAIITQDVLINLLRAIAGMEHGARKRGTRPAEILAPKAGCPACGWADTMEAEYLEVLLLRMASDEALLSRYRSSHGLCLPHFRLATDRARDRAVFDTLVATQKAIWERLVAELGEFIRKRDHRYQHEEWGEESDSWQRAASSLAGIPVQREKRRR